MLVLMCIDCMRLLARSTVVGLVDLLCCCTIQSSFPPPMCLQRILSPACSRSASKRSCTIGLLLKQRLVTTKGSMRADVGVNPCDSVLRSPGKDVTHGSIWIMQKSELDLC